MIAWRIQYVELNPGQLQMSSKTESDICISW